MFPFHGNIKFLNFASNENVRKQHHSAFLGKYEIFVYDSST